MGISRDNAARRSLCETRDETLTSVRELNDHVGVVATNCIGEHRRRRGSETGREGVVRQWGVEGGVREARDSA